MAQRTSQSTDGSSDKSKFSFKYTRTDRSRSHSPIINRKASYQDYPRHHHHRSYRRRLSPSPDQTPVSALDPETAFCEDLFDALGDTEGGAYWAGVYRQPIHTWSPCTTSKTNDRTGKIESMTENEYVSYVRANMWESAHQHQMEERKERDEARARRKKMEEVISRLPA